MTLCNRKVMLKSKTSYWMEGGRGERMRVEGGRRGEKERKEGRGSRGRRKAEGREGGDAYYSNNQCPSCVLILFL